MTDPPFRIERHVRDDGIELDLTGRLELADGDALLAALGETAGDGEQPLRVDLAGLDAADGASTALLLDFCAGRAGESELVGASEPVQRLIDLYRRGEPKVRYVAEEHHGFLEDIGRATAERVDIARGVFGFAGRLLVGTVRAVRRPASVHWADLPVLTERASVDGTPIVLLINFLVGLIMAYQSAIQLQRFGANIFIADLVGLSITRELAPLMTAIIVAGRSGAAFAAELGTMRVREEIDALRTLGLDPIRFLVFPRVLALVIAVPMLTLLGDFVGCAGGLVVAVAQLDLTMVAYLTELQAAIDFWDIAGGLVKAGVFAGTIALISCQRGLATRGSAAAVGESTTSAVVVILFALVSLDAVFTVLYDALGI